MYRWMKEKPDFLHNYACARETSAHSLVEEGLAILDASTPERVHMDNSRANYRRWLAGKMNARYGNKPAVELDGFNGGRRRNPSKGGEPGLTTSTASLDKQGRTKQRMIWRPFLGRLLLFRYPDTISEAKHRRTDKSGANSACLRRTGYDDAPECGQPSRFISVCCASAMRMPCNRDHYE